MLNIHTECTFLLKTNRLEIEKNVIEMNKRYKNRVSNGSVTSLLLSIDSVIAVISDSFLCLASVCYYRFDRTKKCKA